MDIQALFSAWQKKQGANELTGPCPKCGGKDRFIIWPQNNRYFCRQCGIIGSLQNLLYEYGGMDWREAYERLGLPTKTGPTRHIVAKPHSSFPAKQKCDAAVWASMAVNFMCMPATGLDHPQAQEALAKRGLTVETARDCGLGYLRVDMRQAFVGWGMEASKKDDGQTRTCFTIPRGIIISGHAGGKIVALTVRCQDWQAGKDWPPKFRAIPGGQDICFKTPDGGGAVFILESALDACLIWQAMKGACLAVAGMGATKSFDPDTIAEIKAHSPIVAIPDRDEAGKEAWARWQATFPGINLHPPRRKDPGDMLAAGQSIERWLQAGGYLPTESGQDKNSSGVLDIQTWKAQRLAELEAEGIVTDENRRRFTAPLAPTVDLTTPYSLDDPRYKGTLQASP